ncbi:Ldh family oxidoreductase, partial [Acidocella sp.]|uniref:Ldh family oxidoreductase n=1 Tax=Acidocella sp. TaxID=50710 RepID=UPI002F40733D
YAISVVMDVLSGVLSASEFGPGVAGPYQPDKRSGAGHLLIALNVEVFQPLDGFNARMEAMIAGLKGAKLAKGAEEVFYPGEIEARNDQRHRAEGLKLPQDTIADLTKLGEEMQVPFVYK